MLNFYILKQIKVAKKRDLKLCHLYIFEYRRVYRGPERDTPPPLEFEKQLKRLNICDTFIGYSWTHPWHSGSDPDDTSD